MKLVDTLDLKSSDCNGRTGSSPVPSTKSFKLMFGAFLFYISWDFYKSISDNNSDIFNSKALQILEKIIIEKFCSPLIILLMLFSSTSQAEANSKLLLNLDLALFLIKQPSFINCSSDIGQNSINTTALHRHICRLNKKAYICYNFIYF